MIKGAFIFAAGAACGFVYGWVNGVSLGVTVRDGVAGLLKDAEKKSRNKTSDPSFPFKSTEFGN